MTIDYQIRAAALEMAKVEGLDHFSTIYLAMLEGSAITLKDALSAKAQHICSDCGACGEAPCQPT